jgi:hypothetical protein
MVGFYLKWRKSSFLSSPSTSNENFLSSIHPFNQHQQRLAQLARQLLFDFIRRRPDNEEYISRNKSREKNAKRSFMNEFLLLVIVIIYLAISYRTASTEARDDQQSPRNERSSYKTHETRDR